METLGNIFDYIVPPDTPINRALGYRFESSDRISIHLGDSEDESLGQKLHLLKDGMRRLAWHLEHSPALEDVETVSATSWIVTVKPKIMEMLGFKIDNSLPEAEKAIKEYKSKLKQKKIPDDKKHIEPSYSYISKSSLIELYGLKAERD